jgi:succinate dehydrogenase / fumarate reductase cytochrome b subunit
MSTTLRQPQAYNPGMFARLRDGLRYGGGSGQWSWLLHRVTGIGVLLFLIIHIVDTFFVVAYPSLYDHTVGIYGGMLTGLPWESVNGYYWGLRWAFRVGELGLIASVLFHALNGVRIILFDFWPKAAAHQHRLFQVVVVLFFAIMIPVTIWVLLPLRKAPDHWQLPEPAPASTSTLAPLTQAAPVR